MDSEATSLEKGQQQSQNTELELELEPRDKPADTVPPAPQAEDTGINWQGWMTVFGAWLMQFATFGYTYSFGVFQEFYTDKYLKNNSASDIGWVGGVNFMLACGLGLLSGKLFDLGYFYYVEVAGALLYIFSLYMLSLAKPDQFYQVFLAQGVGMGLAIGLTLVPTLGVVVLHFLKKNRALATGVALSGGGCGGIVFPIMINKLLAKHSFGVAVRTSGYVVIGCMVGAVLLMRTKPLPKALASMPNPNPLSFFKELPYVMLIISTFLTLLGVYFPVFFIQLYAIQHEVDMNLAFYSLAIINGASVFGRIVGNRLSDQFGPFNMLSITAVITASTIWAMLGVNDGPSLIAMCIFYGISSGASFSLIAAATAALAKGPREIGLRNGVAFAIGGIALLLSGPIQGAAVGRNFTWIKAIAYSATLIYASTVVLWIARMRLSRERKSQRV